MQQNRKKLLKSRKDKIAFKVRDEKLKRNIPLCSKEAYKNLGKDYSNIPE